MSLMKSVIPCDSFSCWRQTHCVTSGLYQSLHQGQRRTRNIFVLYKINSELFGSVKINLNDHFNFLSKDFHMVDFRLFTEKKFLFVFFCLFFFECLSTKKSINEKVLEVDKGLAWRTNTHLLKVINKDTLLLILKQYLSTGYVAASIEIFSVVSFLNFLVDFSLCCYGYSEKPSSYGTEEIMANIF